jgi:nucleoid DNA-binding protein
MAASKKEIYSLVAAKTDTLKTAINAAETSRVIAMFFETLAELISQGRISELDAVELVTKELKQRLNEV